MPDICHDLIVQRPIEAVFQAVATPAGLDRWWTKRSSGEPRIGAHYEFWFGPEYDWRGTATHVDPGSGIEWLITRADADWEGTRVGIRLEDRGERTAIQFYHTGWKEANAHFRVSNFCWALYLRILRRYLESGEEVAYEDRYDA